MCFYIACGFTSDLTQHHSSRWATTVIPTCVCTYLELCVSGVFAVHTTINAQRVRPWFLCPYLYIYTSLCTGSLMHIIAPTAPLHGAWVSEMRAFRNCGNCRNCSILTPTPIYNVVSKYLPIPYHKTPPTPLQTLDTTTFSPHSHYISTYPCILSYTHAYNIIRKHNPPIGGMGLGFLHFQHQ